MTDSTVLLPFRRPNTATTRPIARRPGRPNGIRRAARDVAATAPVRARRADLLRWALANGRSVDRDSVSVIIAVLHARNGRRLLLTDDLVTELVWIDAVHWCETHCVDRPSGFATSMHALVDFAFSSGWAHRDSDLADELHAVIEAVGAPAPEVRRHRPTPGA
jgi:hypothetical protein